MENIKWTCTAFSDLSVAMLYEILKLRSEVFVVEQQCIFLDMDDKDEKSFHITGLLDNKLIAYSRILPQGLAYAETSIGRVVTSNQVRKSGAGKLLMNYSISKAKELFGNQDIRIGAQLYLRKFYSSLGFIAMSEVYLEDGIEHIEMMLYA